METGALNLDLNEFIDEVEVEDNTCISEQSVKENVKEPKIGMAFDSVDMLINYYIEYGNAKGFPVKKRSSGKGDDGEVKWVVISCSRSGQPRSKSKNAFKMHPVNKINCKAMVRAVLGIDGKWRVTSLMLDHNHALSPGKSRFYKKNRIMRSYVKRRLEMNDRAGIRPNKSFNSFLVESGGHDNVPFLEKDCYNYIGKIRRLRLGDGDSTALLNYFKKMQSDNPTFCYFMDLDEEERLRNVFWADARSRAAYEEFGDAITFDTTYLTNRYDMPFAPFVGVNHHGHSILLGCGLISNEDTRTFTWLFSSWLSCMNGRAPTSIITDQDRAMQKAIEIVFPNTRHRWCLWHIMKKLPEKLRGYKEYQSIKFAMQNAVYDSLTSEEFEKSWNRFIQKFNLGNNDWLLGLYNERRRWVPTYVKDHFWAGMSSTQRSESMHAFFDGYINSKTSLKQFVEQYENALRSKVQKENQDDFNSFNSQVPCITHYMMEKQFQDAYTTAKFKEFQMELIAAKFYCDVASITQDCDSQLYEISENMDEKANRQRIFTIHYNQGTCDIKCNCKLFEFRGILCRHAILVLQKTKIHIAPEKYILRRWRKDVKRCHTKVRITYSDWTLNPENERFDRMCNAFFKTVDSATSKEIKTQRVMRWIKWLDDDLKKENWDDESSLPIPFEAEEHHSLSPTPNPYPTINENTTIRTPLAVRCKGRAPFKRKQSQVERAVKKIKEKKKKEKHKSNENKKKRERECDTLSGGELAHYSDGLTKPSDNEVVSTQEPNIIQSFESGHIDNARRGWAVQAPILFNQNSKVDYFSFGEDNYFNSQDQLVSGMQRVSNIGSFHFTNPPSLFHGHGFHPQIQQGNNYPLQSGEYGLNANSLQMSHNVDMD